MKRAAGIVAISCDRGHEGETKTPAGMSVTAQLGSKPYGDAAGGSAAMPLPGGLAA